MLKLVAVLSVCAVVLVQANREKVFYDPRPETDGGLLETPRRRTAVDLGDDETSDSDWADDNAWPFDFDSLFSRVIGGGQTDSSSNTNGRTTFGELLNKLSERFGGITDGDSLTLPDWLSDRSESDETDIDTDGDNSDVWDRIFGGRRKPWWKGDNVCRRVEEKVVNQTSTTSLSTSLSSISGTDWLSQAFTSLATQCMDSGLQYKCTMQASKNGRRTVKAVIYECCHGYTRKPGQAGCPTEVNLEPIIATLTKLNLTEMVKTLENVELTETLQSGNHTIFAPTNSALKGLNNEAITVSLLDNDNSESSDGSDSDGLALGKSVAKDIISAHISPQWTRSSDWQDEMLLPTLDPQATIRINFYSHPKRFITANCAPIEPKMYDKQASNGLVHVVDKMMMPAKQTIWEIIGQDQRFQTLASLVDDELREQLLDPSAHFTLLAFTDSAFSKLSDKLQQQIRNKEGCFENLVRELLLPNTICSSAIRGRNAIVVNSERHRINATRVDSQVYFNGVKLQVADRMATNGVIQMMSEVVLLNHMTPTLELAAAHDAAFPELLAGTDLNGFFDGEHEITVFLPPKGTLQSHPGASPDAVFNTLKNHVADNIVHITRQQHRIQVPTKAGREIQVHVPRGNPFSLLLSGGRVQATVGCARVLKANVRTCEGMVHYIDRVLSVPEKTVMSILESHANLTKFVEAVRSAEMADQFAAEEFGGTVLAVTDEVFQAMSDAQRERLTERRHAQEFVNRHVRNDKICCHSLKLGGRSSGFGDLSDLFGSLAGSGSRGQARTHHHGRGHHNMMGALRRTGGVHVKDCDMEATNGIVHVLSGHIPQRRSTSISQFMNRLWNQRQRSGNNQRDPFNFNIDWPFG